MVGRHTAHASHHGLAVARALRAEAVRAVVARAAQRRHLTLPSTFGLHLVRARARARVRVRVRVTLG